MTGSTRNRADPADAVDGDVKDLVLSHVRDVPDYPSPGILFKDITPLLADPLAFGAAVVALTAQLPDGVDVVAGVEARGFLLGAPMALRAGAGFVPVRKVGRLPGETVRARYALEYGTAEIEVHADAFTGRRRVAVVDDVLATGGTAAAACDLVERAGGEVVAVVFLLELGFLGGRAQLARRQVHALLTV
jgi:adenine phosphoribosyltransferase